MATYWKRLILFLPLRPVIHLPSLQRTGTAIAWDSEKALQLAVAKRLIEFQIEKVIGLWQFKAYSPSLPSENKTAKD